GRNVALSPGGTNVWALSTLLNGSGLRLYMSNNPCANGQFWNISDNPRSGSPDYPRLVRKRNTGVNFAFWATWNEIDPVDGLNKIYISQIGDAGWTTIPQSNRCGQQFSGRSMQFANAAFIGDSDRIAVVFLDSTDSTVRTMVFNANTGTWDCGSRKLVGTFTRPVGTCGSCPGIGTYQNLDSSCLRGTFNPNIAVATTGSTSNLVVTYTSQAPDASCPSMHEV